MTPKTMIIVPAKRSLIFSSLKNTFPHKIPNKGLVLFTDITLATNVMEIAVICRARVRPLVRPMGASILLCRKIFLIEIFLSQRMKVNDIRIAQVDAKAASIGFEFRTTTLSILEVIAQIIETISIRRKP